MNVNTHTNVQRTNRPEDKNESLSLEQANGSQNVTQDSTETKASQIVLHCLEEKQESIYANVNRYKRKFDEVEGEKESPITRQAKVIPQWMKKEVIMEHSALNLNEKLLEIRTEKKEEPLGVQSIKKLSQDSSESKTTQIALNCLEQQQESLCGEIKKIVPIISPNTDHTELGIKVESLVKQLKWVNVNEEIKENLNHLQLSLYKDGFENLSDKIRDVMPFMWNDLPKDMQRHIVSQMSNWELLKIHPSKEFRVVVDLEIIKRINNKIRFPAKRFVTIMRSLKNQGTQLKYLGWGKYRFDNFVDATIRLDNFVNVIECCPNLEEIELVDHSLAIVKLAEQSKLSRLKTLEFSSITFPGLQAIANAPLSTLRSLNLDFRELGDQGFKCICQSSTLINLTSLDFSRNQIKSAGLQGLQAIAEAKFKLQELYLRVNKIVSFPNNLDTLKDLKVLDLSHNRLSAAAVGTIFKLSELTELNLGSNYLTDESLPEINVLQLSKLKILKLIDNNISYRGIEKIAPLISRLSVLCVDHNKMIGFQGLTFVLKEKPKLTELGFAATSIGEDGLIKILDFENFSFLRKLNIAHNEVSDKFWLRVSRIHDERTHLVSNLKKLDISCKKIDKEKIKMLWESFPLKTLTINHSCISAHSINRYLTGVLTPRSLDL